MSEKKLITKEDFWNLKDCDVIKFSTTNGYTCFYKTTHFCLNELCYKVSTDWRKPHKDNDIFIVDSTYECHCRNDLIIKITDKTQKSRSRKDKAIILVDPEMKKYTYLASDLQRIANSSVSSFFLQTGE